MNSPRQKSLEEILSLFRPEDTLAVPLATGQPMGLLQALDKRADWKRLEIFTGLLSFPYPILTNPTVFVTSGYYGPIERYLNEQGAHMNYLPSDFTGFETYARKVKPRILATTLSPPDEEGFLTFGTHAAAIAKPFAEALKNPDQIAIAEVNPRMPIVYGDPQSGDNKVHINDLRYFFESDQSPLEIPAPEITEVERKISENVASLIENESTLQFGIGGIPNQVASLLAESSVKDLGIHSELISDGFLKLWEAGKISNRHKGIFKGQSVFTFALGSQKLYDALDERKGKNKRQAICLPVSVVNDPHVISQNKNMVSINSGFMIDFAGQVCSEAIGLRQYSGVGGQLSFVAGAYGAENGKSVICIKSTVEVDGKLISNIVPTLPPGSLVSTPRHYVQYIVTEYGIVNLYGKSDEERPKELIKIAHPNFREELTARYEEIKKTFYKN